MGIALGLQTLHGLGHGVDFHPVPLLELSDNHPAGEGSAHLPVREGFSQHFLCGGDGALKGIRIGSAERNSKNRFFHTIFSCCIFKMDAVKAKAQTAQFFILFYPFFRLLSMAFPLRAKPPSPA